MNYTELLWYAFCGITVTIIGFHACVAIDKVSDKLDQVIEKFNENHPSGENK